MNNEQKTIMGQHKKQMDLILDRPFNCEAVDLETKQAEEMDDTEKYMAERENEAFKHGTLDRNS